MEFPIPKPETEKSDTPRAPTKIPPISRVSSSSIKPVTSRIGRSVVASQSKIPKRDIGMLKKPPVQERNATLKIIKHADNKKSSKSSVSLIQPKTPRQSSVISSRSNMTNYKTLMKPREQTPRSNNSEQLTERFQKASDRITAKKNVMAFENMKEKVRSYQTEFMKKWEQVKDSLPPGEGEYKLIGIMKNNDGLLVTKSPQKIKVKCAPKSLEDFKKDMNSYVHNNLSIILDSLDQLKNSPTKVGDTKGFECLTAIEDVKKKIKVNHLNALGDMLQEIECFETEVNKPAAPQSLPSLDSSINAELEGKMNKLLKEVDELKTNLEQSQKELSRIKKSNEDKDVSYKKELEEKDKKLSKKQLEIEELKKKHENMEKDNTKEKSSVKELTDKLTNKSAEVEDLKKKVKNFTQSITIQEAKNQEHETRIKKLQVDLASALKDVEKRTRMEHSIGDQATKQADEIKVLKTDLVNMKRERDRFEKEIHSLKKESDDKSHLDKKHKLAEAEIVRLRQTVGELEAKLQEAQALSNRSFPDELARLQKSDSDKTQKIEVLEMELTKAHFQIQKLEEKIVMDRKLLKVRCSLIESLQTKENTQKIHLEDLFAEVGERNNDIQMLKSELITKNEEFQSLFATLSAKQLELTRQEHMIKLLQESNERAQTLRVKQEAKIGRLEEEIAQLKQTISLYQDAVLPNNALRKNLLMAESSRENDINDTVGYYVDERRRKRHIDINVKKYEK